jgi:uncharacterized caspase-like protein
MIEVRRAGAGLGATLRQWAPRRIGRALLWAAVAIAPLWGAGTANAAAAKVALVVGNSAYEGADRLQTPVNDARLVGEALRDDGFETHVATNLTLEEFKAEVAWLARQSETAGVVVFYFAGHGFESGGENFLVPVDAGAPIGALTHAMLVKHGLKLSAIRALMRHGQPPVTISLLDICRTPSRGSAPVTALKREQAAHGELIAYSTGDNKIAYDSMRTFGQPLDDSPFAWYLAMNFKAQGLTLKQALEHTQQQVAQVSAGDQQPWIVSGLDGDLALADPAPERGAAFAVSPERPGATRGPQQAVRTTRDDDARADAWDDLDAQIAEEARNADAATVAKLRSRAQRGDAAAATTLGLIAESSSTSGSTGTSAAGKRSALAYYRKAAAQQFPVAQALLGEAYMSGALVPRDLTKAEPLLAQAADAGLTRAKLDLMQLRAQRGQGDSADEMQSAMKLIVERLTHAQGTTGSPAQSH